MKIQTNHPFTKAQLNELQKQLNIISDIEITATNLKGLPGKNGYFDIQILSSPYTTDVFLSFWEKEFNGPKNYMYSINTQGQLNQKPKSSLEFQTLADRVHFFNTLEPINFKKV